MKNAKKGFTLIEIAIVLVVIGLILGMVMKGRSLIDAAQTRSEINKINKLQAAYTSFMSKHNRRPGTTGTDPNTTAAIYRDLISEGMITAADFTIPSLNQNWAFTGCNVAVGNWGNVALALSPNVCLTTVASAAIAETNVTAPATAAVAPARFVCFIETMLDDRNPTTGQGRGIAAEYPIAALNLDTCDESTGAGAIIYSYRIF